MQVTLLVALVIYQVPTSGFSGVGLGGIAVVGGAGEVVGAKVVFGA